MKTYQVEWTVTIDADSEHEAAWQAFTMQRDPESIATVFHVRLHNKPSDDYTIVDLDDYYDPTCPYCARTLEGSELTTGVCTSDDCPRHDSNSACPVCGADGGTQCGAVNCGY